MLISVVVGLGIAHLLTGFGRLIHRADSTRISAAHILWTAYIFFFMVIYWWTVVFGYHDWPNWNILIFLFILAYGVVLFLLAVVLYPTDLPEPWDMQAHFIRMRHWFFGIFIVLVVTELADTGLKRHFDDFALPYLLMTGSWITCGVLGWISTNSRTQTVLAGYCLVTQLAWAGYQLRDLEWMIAS